MDLSGRTVQYTPMPSYGNHLYAASAVGYKEALFKISAANIPSPNFSVTENRGLLTKNKIVTSMIFSTHKKPKGRLYEKKSD